MSGLPASIMRVLCVEGLEGLEGRGCRIDELGLGVSFLTLEIQGSGSRFQIPPCVPCAV